MTPVNHSLCLGQYFLAFVSSQFTWVLCRRFDMHRNGRSKEDVPTLEVRSRSPAHRRISILYVAQPNVGSLTNLVIVYVLKQEVVGGGAQHQTDVALFKKR